MRHKIPSRPSLSSSSSTTTTTTTGSRRTSCCTNISAKSSSSSSVVECKPVHKTKITYDDEHPTNELSWTLGKLKGEFHCFTLQEFLNRFVPSLPSLTTNDTNHHLLHLWQEYYIIAVKNVDQIVPLESYSNRKLESHSSILHHCIVSMVHQHQRCTSRVATNLLAQGYTWLEHSNTTSTSSCGGITNVHQCQWNAAVDHLKTCPAIQMLHKTVGDDILRYIFQNTSLFWKIINTNGKHPTILLSHNYWQLTGIPCTAFTYTNKTKATIPKKSKYRKKKKPKYCLAQQVSLGPLAPDQYLIHTHLFYSNRYVRRVGSTNLLPMTTTVSSGKDFWMAATMEYRMVFANDHPNNHHFILASTTTPSWCNDCFALTTIRRLDYTRILEHYCPIPNNYQSFSISRLAQTYVDSQCVVSFCRACLSKLLPLDQFWGSQHNANVFLQSTIHTFVHLRRREKFSNTLLLQHLRPTHMKWLQCTKKNSSSKQHDRARLMLLSVLRYIMTQYVIPLLAQAFYVTETEFGGLRVYYYRKPIWAAFAQNSLHHLSNKMVELPNEEHVAQRLSTLGMSKLRLVPKRTGVRPIATLCHRERFSLPISTTTTTTTKGKRNMDDCDQNYEYDPTIETQYGPSACKKSKTCHHHTIVHPPRIPVPNQSRLSTNQLLADSFAVLSFEQKDHYGSGLPGLHQFYARYRHFLQQWNRAHNPPLYIGSVDIRHCYDNISQERLLQLLEDHILLKATPEYIIQHYNILQPTSEGRVRWYHKRRVEYPEQVESFATLVQQLSRPYTHSVLVDGVQCVAIQRKHILAQLQEHIQNHVTILRGRHGQRYFWQTRGIPQGSVVSSYLCNVYYGYVEKILLTKTSGTTSATGTTSANNKANTEHAPVELLARMVDDFVFITSNLSDLERFFHIMHTGDKELGVEINHDKTQSSIPLTMEMTNGSTKTVRMENKQSSLYFPWCGMMIDTSTGQVRNDYSRFVDIKGSETLTVQRTLSPGLNLLGQLRSFVQPRCIPIYFDPFINPITSQVINFYQLMVFCAIKTSAYLTSLSTSTTSAALCNVPFLLSSIDVTLDYALRLIVGRLRKAYTKMDLQFPRSSLLNSPMAIWLGWQAFFDVFVSLSNPDFEKLAHEYLSDKAIHALHSVGINEKRTTFWKRTIAVALCDMKVSTLL